MTAVVPLAVYQVREAGEMFARAFTKDPFYIYVLPDEKKRLKALTWLFTAATLYGCLYGEVHVTQGQIHGAAVWLSSSQTTLRMLRAGMTWAPFKLGLKSFLRLWGSLSLVEQLHKQAMPQRHLYLMMLAVDPNQQGKGIGRSLLEKNLSRADVERLACYLETTLPTNVPMYRKFGFEVVLKDDFPGGGPRYWTMRRLPR